MLLIVSLVGVRRRHARGRLSERRTTARIMLLALLAGDARDRPARPRHRPRLHADRASRSCSSPGTAWKHLAGACGARRARVRRRARGRAGARRQRAPGLPEAAAHDLPQPAGRLHAKDPTCYQLQQSTIAIGSGQKTGRGAASATQTTFGLHPEADDDFIFAVVGETYGFAGAALVLSLYALLIWRTLRILTMAKNLFGTLIAGGILAMFMFQVFVNVGMTVGIMPVTGVPLPLHQLRRLIGARHIHGHRSAAVDPRASADGVGGQGRVLISMAASTAMPPPPHCRDRAGDNQKD